MTPPERRPPFTPKPATAANQRRPLDPRYQPYREVDSLLEVRATWHQPATWLILFFGPVRIGVRPTYTSFDGA